MIITVTVSTLLLAFVIAELLYIRYNGQVVAAPDIPRAPLTIGEGSRIKYAILGDSTAVGQGGDYKQGIAVRSAEMLAQSQQVTYQNFAVSGATVANVLERQTEGAIEFNPDVVLLSVGANDVTHLTSSKAVARDLRSTIVKLRKGNPEVKIVITGSPQMGSVPRLPQPVRYFAGLKTASINAEMFAVAKDMDVTIAPIAAQTGALFSNNPALFAPDNFHPNNEGYSTWVPVINKALLE